jgi:hypothetical protein
VFFTTPKNREGEEHLRKHGNGVIIRLDWVIQT